MVVLWRLACAHKLANLSLNRAGQPCDRVAEALEIRGLLERNSEELDGVLRALNGEYILPEAGGDLLRDGAGVLPTGAALTHCFAQSHFCCRNITGMQRSLTLQFGGPLQQFLQLRS